MGIDLRIIVTTLVVSFWALPVMANASKDYCVPIDAKLQISLASENCESVAGLCTEGTVRGVGLSRWFRGETRYVLSDLQPGAITDPNQTGAIFSFAGVFRLNTPYGRIDATDLGSLDYSSNRYTQFFKISGGTGLFHNAAGVIYSNGTLDEDGQGSRGSFSGRICWDL